MRTLTPASAAALDPADIYVIRAEALIGHSLDGRHGVDGYSIDNALCYFRAGISVDDFITIITSSPTYRRRRPCAFAVRYTGKFDGLFVPGKVYLASPWANRDAPYDKMLCVFVRGRCRRIPPEHFEPLRARHRGLFPRLVIAALHAASVRFELTREAA